MDRRLRTDGPTVSTPVTHREEEAERYIGKRCRLRNGRQGVILGWEYRGGQKRLSDMWWLFTMRCDDGGESRACLAKPAALSSFMGGLAIAEIEAAVTIDSVLRRYAGCGCACKTS